jgi:transcriptional regulator with XRE-family HTH domain
MRHSNLNRANVAVGQTLAKRRRELRISAAEFGGAFGLSPERVLDIEAGRMRLSASLLIAISDYLGVEPTSFFKDISVV